MNSRAHLASLLLSALGLFLAGAASAQQSVLPGFQVERNASGSTIYSFVPNQALKPSSTAVLATALQVKNNQGQNANTLNSFQVSADATLSGAAWWVMLFDATAAPADGAVTPAKCYALASGATSLMQSLNIPLLAANGGWQIVVSTTGCFTKTASVHAFISAEGQ